mmetsp:Transcript_15709/g.24119  ORF Transcript_15709/g.24119 Transcript_15709/m.24119 type:complete len:107 (+) Transcript_15709:455-775(+)
MKNRTIEDLSKENKHLVAQVADLKQNLDRIRIKYKVDSADLREMSNSIKTSPPRASLKKKKSSKDPVQPLNPLLNPDDDEQVEFEDCDAGIDSDEGPSKRFEEGSC